MPKTSRYKVPSSSSDEDAALERRRGYKRKYAEKNRELVISRATKWNREHPERRVEIRKKYRDANLEEIHYKNKTYRMKYRKLVMEHYSSGKNECACCGENIPEFMTIDHINGGGNTHRRETKNRGGHHFYFWLIQNKYPEGYQVLCFNCNMGKSHFGVCPHTTADL